MSDEEMSQCDMVRKKSSDKYDLLQHRMENFDVETTALHRKLQSKVDALRILRKELEKFRVERDQFKLMAETLQLRYSAIKRNSDFGGYGIDGSKITVKELLHETRERNIKLTMEVEALKQKLHELQGDIDLLRAKEPKMSKRRQKEVSENKTATVEDNEELQWKKERANFISHLENLKKKNAQLSFDFKSIIDEKEELITERDAYKCKSHRLNHELLTALKANKTHPKFIDIDGILLENKYLNDHSKHLEDELVLCKQTITKYKSMLETKRKKSIMRLGTNSNEDVFLSHKQVKAMLEYGIEVPSNTESTQDLKALCLGLFDNLNDKNLALSHQKKTNKILATKIAELEQKIKHLSAGELNTSDYYSPSDILLNGYSPSSVDSNCSSDDVKVLKTSPTPTPTSAGSDDADYSQKIQFSTIEEEEPNEIDVLQQRDNCISDDNISSLSTESARSILSSEYGVDINNSSNVINDNNPTYDFNTTMAEYNSLVPSSIAKQRMNDLKDLPPELAALVQKALHELDMRDFDEIIPRRCTENGVAGKEPEQFEEQMKELSAMN